MDKKRFFMTAVVGLMVAKPAAATLSEIDKRLDTALSDARQEQRSEQPMALEADGQVFDGELTARMY